MEGTTPGQLVVEYANPKCPALPRNLAGVDIRIPQSGYLCTSTPIHRGWSYQAYVLEGPTGSKPLKLGKDVFNHSTFKYGKDTCNMVGESFFFLPDGIKVKSGADFGKLFLIHHGCDPVETPSESGA